MASTFAQSASAQPPLPPGTVPATDTVLDFEIIPESTFEWVALVGAARGPQGPVGEVGIFDFRIRDLSIDPSNTYTPGKPSQEHFTTFRILWLDSSTPESPAWAEGGGQWVYDDATAPTMTYSGQISNTLRLSLKHTPIVTVPAAGIRVVANMTLLTDQTIYKEKTVDFFARIVPSPSIVSTIVYGDGGTPLQAAPNTWVTVKVEVTNPDLYLQHINIEMPQSAFRGEGVDPSQIPVSGDLGGVLEPLSTKTFNLTFKTPKHRTYFGSLALTYSVRAYNANQPDVDIVSSSVIIIQGVYISTPLKVLLVLVVILFILFLLILFKGKRYYDENILGKPIPPWRIKEEAAALDVVRKTDPRSFYVTRYFLMVEEYESALNWFYSYKRRTKKAIQRDAKSARLAERAGALKTPNTDRFDRRAERIKRRIHQRQERRRLQLEAKLTRFQSTVEQHYEEDHEKDHAKWEKKVETLKAKANKPWYRARKKWEREVEKTVEAWERPFAKEKAKREKEIETAKAKYAKQVQRKDKEAWRNWREAIETNEEENKIREKEGREPLPEPLLVSEVVGPADLPKPFKEPPKPKLPPEPKEPVVEGLPPEPKLTLPKLDESHYARKAKRARKKTERKVRRLERKMERMLAKNERDRVKSIARANRKREKLLRKSHRIIQPTLMDRLFRNTPEHRERRAHKKLLKALAGERVKAVEESEHTRLEVLHVEAQRREAELLAKLARHQAEVRKGGGTAAMHVEDAPELVSLREQHQSKLEREKLAAKKKVEAERQKAEVDLRTQLAEELVKERAERERLQEQKAAAIQARADAKKASKSAPEPEPEEPAPEPAKPKKKGSAKREKK